MKKILLTGRTGFVGRNILPILKEEYEIHAPTRQELDLKNSSDVENIIKKENYDVVLHFANPNPVKNVACDKQDTMLEDSMRIFMNFYNVRNYYGKMLYLGSGAEYDKSRDLHMVTEEQVTESIPKDIYGLAKFYMNELARASENVYNLRVFGCYGKYDHESKFLTHVIRSCLENKEITIRQNCYFDYMQVFDLAKVVIWAIENEMKYHDYNVCSGTRISLIEIAEKIKREMDSSEPIILLQDGLNKEYTASNSRLLAEANKIEFTSIENGIKLQIEYERKALQ